MPRPKIVHFSHTLNLLTLASENIEREIAFLQGEGPAAPDQVLHYLNEAVTATEVAQHRLSSAGRLMCRRDLQAAEGAESKASEASS